MIDYIIIKQYEIHQFRRYLIIEYFMQDDLFKFIDVYLLNTEKEQIDFLPNIDSTMTNITMTTNFILGDFNMILIRPRIKMEEQITLN